MTKIEHKYFQINKSVVAFCTFLKRKHINGKLGEEKLKLFVLADFARIWL